MCPPAHIVKLTKGDCYGLCLARMIGDFAGGGCHAPQTNWIGAGHEYGQRGQSVLDTTMKETSGPT